jgi:hypothetical protein
VDIGGYVVKKLDEGRVPNKKAVYYHPQFVSTPLFGHLIDRRIFAVEIFFTGKFTEI